MKFEMLNPVFAASARVAILATLANGRPWLFSDLKDETGLADGNLHVQTRKLRDAGYIKAEKVNPGGRRVTRFLVTESGKKALADYISLLERAILSNEPDEDQGVAKTATRKNDGGRVW